jgi:hypothetical protein
MTKKLCLRCDWSGTTSAEACPHCGAPLFASGVGSTEVRGSARRGARQRSSSEVSSTSPPPTVQRSWRNRIAVGLILALALGAVIFVQRHTPQGTAAANGTGLHGYLLSAARESDDIRLWVWDLAAGTARPGPVLAGLPEQLVYVYLDEGGWVGVTTPTDSHTRTASIVRYLGTTDRAIPVATGRLISWVPGESYVSVVRSAALGGCRQRVTISTWFVTSRREERRFNGIVCGEPTAFARDRLAAYLTVEREGLPTTWQVGNGSLLPTLPNHRLLGMSGQGDLLVQGARSSSGLELFSPPPSPRSPIPLGIAGEPLHPNRVLGWSARGDRAFVLGTHRDVHGIFQVAIDPLAQERGPQLVLTTAAIDVQAAPTTEGDLYLATDGAISLFRDGQIFSIAAPFGAPKPVGPLLWVSALPYSLPEQP